jgi:hypothetical protein
MVGDHLPIIGFQGVVLRLFRAYVELYAFWAFVPPLLATHAARTGNANLNISLLAFAVIAGGAVGCMVGGYVSLRVGSARVAFAQLAAAGLCCLLSPLVFYGGSLLFLPFLLFWGVVTVASPQFSALNAHYAPADQVGSALTIAHRIGFGISIVSIQLLNTVAGTIPAHYLFVLLVPGPILGLRSLRPLLSRTV